MTVGRRLLVVGASSGIGRALAVAAGAAGWRVVAAARRAEALATLRAEAAGSVEILTADVRRDDDCRRVVDQAVATMGGLDALVYASGTSPLARLVDTDGDAWRTVLETNVVGAAQVCRAALPHLTESRGTAVFLSSVATDDPRPYLVAYGASKAALDATIRGWRNEHPDLCFVRVVVGPTATGFGTDWDADTLAAFAQVRQERGLLRSTPMTAEEVAVEVLHVLDAPVWAHDIALMPRNWST